ncbi:TAXI family TRAP transporter solute-binding subunit [Psychromonas sp. 14N.309.X.WAT.B.A12]|uniref:TAXI family TRAP transporter solute-binding subunit n=1 Tax=Psychromonas sp. 14N.309.X.WAT.B.A12 TaxID=2998322 RepID=UPI0025AF67C0|nr:TAXI family TRAP transporter solute-binding subunit [Psychromonas sp. 14N.309.X.WAT.B.A12]MDN2663794.1 TAXI family TRAP transporter solute-binding subunit [Psychromonas sp. 14N.309.X.WAT.B.A12]
MNNITAKQKGIFSSNLVNSNRFLKALAFPINFFIVGIMLCVSSSSAVAQDKYVSIGTGGISGVYYPTGGAICFLLNQVRGLDNIHCDIKSTPGSIYNLEALKQKQIDVVVVQSDWQFHVYKGSSLFKKEGKFSDLRSLFSVHSEPFTVLAREDANIQRFEDLKGKRVNIGAANSGQRATMEMLLDLYHWQASDFEALTSLTPSEQAQALCDQKIDAIVYVVGHPNSSIKEATSACKTQLVNITGEKISTLIDTHRYYESANIAAGMYRGSPDKTETFGVGATIVTTASLPDHIAYEMVKAVFEHHQEFIQLHPSFKGLTKQEMVSQYLTAPLHPGALRYYKEVGLVP